MVQFAQTGKLSLSSFATNFVSMMIRMEEAALAAKAANAVLGWLTGPSYTNSYASAGTDVSGGNISFISGITKNANGGVYDSPSLAAYENQILSKPTLFRFANGGALGVAGEAAGESEAIMPLAKTSNGKLGVQLVGNQSQDIELQINITNKGQPAQARQTGMQRNGKKIMVDLMLDAVAGDVAKGGKTAKAMQ